MKTFNSLIGTMIIFIITLIMLSACVPARRERVEDGEDGNGKVMELTPSTEKVEMVIKDHTTHWKTLTGKFKKFDRDARYTIVMIEEHKYIVFMSSLSQRAGITMVHSASCYGFHGEAAG